MQDHVETSTSYRLISHLRCLFFCVPRVWISETQVFCVKHDWWGRDTAKHVIYTVFLAFPKCLTQLQSFSIEMVVYPTQSDGLLWARLPLAAPVVATTCDSSITLPRSEIWWCKSQDIVYHNPLTKQPVFEVTSNSLWRWCNCCYEYYRIISMMPHRACQAMFLVHLCYSRASDWAHNGVWSHL